MEITEKDIKHLASLSRLEFSDDEIEKFSSEFASIIDYVNQLQKVDTTNVEDKTPVREFEELRDDVVKPSLPNEKIIENAPIVFINMFSDYYLICKVS